MSYSWLSIMGMYEYDPSVMDGLKVPDGVDKESVINNILLNCAELELIYSNIDTMKLAIKTWSDSNQIGWDKLYKTMTVEYNPIWNVDANISEKIDRDTTGINSVKGFNETDWAESNKGVTDEGIVRTETRSGNIGVTATQDLLKKEREIAEFNIVEYITDSFKKRFCLMIY